MTPWDRLRHRAAGMSDQDGRRWVLVGVPSLIAIATAIVAPWAIWPTVIVAVQLVAIGAVVFVAVRLALRGP